MQLKCSLRRAETTHLNGFSGDCGGVELWVMVGHYVNLCLFSLRMKRIHCFYFVIEFYFITNLNQSERESEIYF